MLRVGCKGFTRKNPGGKLCGVEGREIEKRYSCRNIGYAGKKKIFIKMDEQKYQIGTGKLLLLMSLGLSSVPGY